MATSVAATETAVIQDDDEEGERGEGEGSVTRSGVDFAASLTHSTTTAEILRVKCRFDLEKR